MMPWNEARDSLGTHIIDVYCLKKVFDHSDIDIGESDLVEVKGFCNLSGQ